MITNILKNTHFLVGPRCLACRFLSSQVKMLPQNARKMQGWQIHAYGDLDELQLDQNIKIPALTHPSEVLVKVSASSVNPIDIAMIGSYGANLLNALRPKDKDSIEFPLILGRDFTGTVVQKGLGVSDRELDVGDDVWGVVPVHKQGCHAEFVVVDKSCLSQKPAAISNIDGSAILYAGLTAWSGLFISAQLGSICGALTSSGGGRGKRVLVLGASGGVGSMAIQILLAENCEVYATCSTDAMPLVKNLGIDAVFDYKDPKHIADLILCGPYDIILDCAGKGTEYANEVKWQFKNYVTFNSPLLKNIDSFGMISGAFRNAVNIVQNNLTSIGTQNGAIKWGYFMPAPQGIAYLKNLVERGKLLPVVEQVYAFEQAIDAYQHVKKGHLRGKIVIDFK